MRSGHSSVESSIYLRKLAKTEIISTMDPVSLIGLIAATAQLLQMCGGIAKRCHTACGHFKEASRTLNAIATECRTFEAAITTIQDWIENTLRNSSQKEKLIEPLSSAIEGFMSSISELDKEVAKFGGDEDTLSRSTRARYVWNEAFMKDHLSEIRAQATALHLLLTASQLYVCVILYEQSSYTDSNALVVLSKTQRLIFKELLMMPQLYIGYVECGERYRIFSSILKKARGLTKNPCWIENLCLMMRLLIRWHIGELWLHS